MAISEGSRHQLYQRLEEVLGGEEATTLMEHLPPVGWADVATRRDVDNAEFRIKAELREEIAALRTELKVEIANLRTEFAAALNRQTYRFVGFTTAVVVGTGFLN